MVSIEEKEKTFEKELQLIFDEHVREFTRLCIVSAPDYFFTDCPAWIRHGERSDEQMRAASPPVLTGRPNGVNCPDTPLAVGSIRVQSVSVKTTLVPQTRSPFP